MKANGYFAFFADVYNLLKTYPEDLAAADDPFWEQTIKTAGEIRAKYDHEECAEMSARILLEVLTEMERIYRKQKAARCDDPTAQAQTT